MTQAFDDILFDDVAIINASRGVMNFGNTSISDNMDCTNNFNDCTNNFYVPQDEEFNTAQTA